MSRLVAPAKRVASKLYLEGLTMNPANFKKSISWQDFTPQDTSPIPPREARTVADAKTPSNISFTKNADGKWIVDPTNFNVTLSMNVTNSWVVTGKQTDSLLNHEQQHYNITALGARDFLNDALALVADKPADLTKALTDLQKSMQTQIKAINKVYDEDPNCGTDHNNKADKQSQWDLRIKNAMNSSTTRLDSLATCPAPTSSTP
jgi:hypothetical protein